MASPELSGVSIVLNGAFNPAVFHPKWLADRELLSQEVAQHAVEQTSPQPLIVTAQFTSFVADWLTVQIRQEQMMFYTVEEAREQDLRDFGVGVLSLLPENPVDALGINCDAHFRVASEEQWHAFGDRYLPKDAWEDVFPDGSWVARTEGKRVGLRTVTVEVARGKDGVPGFVRIEVAPSVRVLPFGIYCAINGHYSTSHEEGSRGTAGEYASILAKEWSSARETGIQLLTNLEGSI